MYNTIIRSSVKYIHTKCIVVLYYIYTIVVQNGQYPSNEYMHHIEIKSFISHLIYYTNIFKIASEITDFRMEFLCISLNKIKKMPIFGKLKLQTCNFFDDIFIY